MAHLASAVSLSSTLAPATTCRVEPASADFAGLHDGSSPIRVLSTADEPLFHEAGVWMPASSEWLVSSDRLLPGTPETHVKLSAVHWPSGRVRALPELSKLIVMGNGATTDHQGGAYICSQGMGEQSGALWRCDPTMTQAKLVGPPEGLTLNSLNDVVVDRASGELIFTDPAYGCLLYTSPSPRDS